jgi:hypothetical protein
MYMNWLSRTVGAGWLAAASATLASSTAAVSGAVGVALAFGSHGSSEPPSARIAPRARQASRNVSDTTSSAVDQLPVSRNAWL